MIVGVLGALVLVPVAVGMLMLVRVPCRPVRMLVRVGMHVFVIVFRFHCVPPGGPSGRSVNLILPLSRQGATFLPHSYVILNSHG